VSEYAYFPPI